MNKLRTPDPDGFAEFWSIWLPYKRKTDGRLDAVDGYRKHILGGSLPEDIIDGARWFIRDWASLPPEKREYIPLAKTWLNKGIYLDDCEKERAFREKQAIRETNVVQMVRAAPLPANHFLNTYKAKQEEPQP